MSAFQDLEAEPPAADAVVGRLDEIVDELAAVVADTAPAIDARIDRIARLEKLRAVTAALQAAESVRFAQSQVAEQLAADVHPGGDRSRHRRTDRAGLPHLPRGRGAAAQHRAGVVV